MGFAALHHPLQHGPFAEVLQVFEVPPEFTEVQRVTFQALFQPPDSARGGGGVWPCSCGKYTVRIWQRQVSSLRTLPRQRSSSLCSSPGWLPPGLSHCPSTRSRRNNRPKAARCTACSSRPTCSIAATAMLDPPCASTSRTGTCSTPIADWAPARSPPSSEPWHSSAWATPAPVRPASSHWIRRWPCRPAPSPTNSNGAWSELPCRTLSWNRFKPGPT